MDSNNIDSSKIPDITLLLMFEEDIIHFDFCILQEINH